MKEETTYTYALCRVAARKALKSAQEVEQGNLYWRMMAGVFAAFTIEAYLNHLGQRRVLDWDVFERKLGPREKLLFLQRVLHLSVDQSKRPFQTLREILRLRDSLAHGKTTTDTTDDSKSAGRPQPPWMKLCALRSVTRMVDDAEAMVRELHAQSDGSNLDALDMLGYGFG